MFFRIAPFFAPYAILHGLIRCASTEVSQTLEAPVVERTAKDGDTAADQELAEAGDKIWWISDGEQHANHRKKIKPTVRDSHLSTWSEFQAEDQVMSDSAINKDHQESISVDGNGIVLTNEESIDMEEEAELIHVEYRYNVFPESKFQSDEVLRRVDTKVWEPIRILPWFTLNNLDYQTAEYIKHVVKAAVAYLEKLMLIERGVGKLKLSGKKDCGDNAFIPSSHRNVGVDADVVIYVTAKTNTPWCDGGGLAFAGVCKRDYPKRRPVAGYMNYCKVSSEQRRNKWRSDVQIAVHEISHVLFWLYSHFKAWRDENGNERGLNNVRKCEYILGEERCYVVSPNVKRTVQDHFNCKTAKGLELEHQGQAGTKNQHMDAKLYQEDVMTGIADRTMRVFSTLNLAMMHDSGWYYPNYGREGQLNWGKGKGCKFLEKCVSNGQTLFSDHFCTDVGYSGCLHNNRGRGKCDLKKGQIIPWQYQYFKDQTMGGQLFSNYCPMLRPNTDINEGSGMCNDPSDGFLIDIEIYGSYHGEASRCIEGSLFAKNFPSSYFQDSVCYEIKCIGSAPFWSGVEVKLAFGSSVTCKDNEFGNKKTLVGYNGFILCPDVAIVCPGYDEKPTFCDNGDWNSKGEYCECWLGYTGKRCSAKLRERDPTGCHWDDALLKITHPSIAAPGNTKVLRSLGGMGSPYAYVKSTSLLFTNSNLDGCGSSFGTLDLIGNVVYVRSGSCELWRKAYNAQKAGAAGILIASPYKSYITPLAQSSYVSIPVRVVTGWDAEWIEANLYNATTEITCPDFSVDVHELERDVSKQQDTTQLIVKRFNEGSCISNKCKDVETAKDCMALTNTETWASSSNFYVGKWEPNASDGKPAPDGCYIRLSPIAIFWNYRATLQNATKDREKICVCSSELSTNAPTRTPTNLQIPEAAKPEETLDQIPEQGSKPEKTVEFRVERFNEGSCLSNKCKDITTSKQCRALIGTETWASASNFYEGTWEPYASDGKPAPDRCYIRLSSMAIYWNNRATLQDATKDRQKICLCQSGLNSIQSTETPTGVETTEGPTMKPSVSLNTLNDLIKSKIPNCDTLHMYPVVEGVFGSNKLSYKIILLPYVSTGIKFTLIREMFISGARLKAALADGTRTWFQLFEFDDDGKDKFIDVSPAVIGTGVGDAEQPGFNYYTGEFESVHHLKVGKTYGVSYLFDRKNSDPEWSLQSAVYKIDKPWTNDFATQMQVLSSNKPWTTISGDINFPDIKQNIVPQLDLCE